MHVACAAVLLLLVTASCAHVKPDTQVSEASDVATQPDTPQPAPTPAAPATPQPAPESVAPATPQPDSTPAAPATPQPPKPAAQPTPQPTPRPVARATPQPGPKPAAPATPQAEGNAAPPVAKTPAVAPALDLNKLEAQLRATKAIGVFTKITLKNQVDDLLDKFRQYYQGKAKLTMTDLRRAYDMLMMKVLSLLQDDDQRLASSIVSSREAIWGLLADPKKFATFQG